jgi:protein TonB
MPAEVVFSSTQPARSPAQYGRRDPNPVRRYAGIGAVLLLHIFFIWALMNGLANKVVQIVQKPIETKIIEPVKPPPPPPMPA